MRARLLLLAALAACGLASQAAAKPDYPPGALDRRQQIMPHIGPVTRAWVAGEARRLADGTASDVTGDIHGADLGIPAGADVERAKKLLQKAETNCLVANSLTSERHLTMEVAVG